jgi:predicted DNA-binding transcriptional regulator AlpA
MNGQRPARIVWMDEITALLDVERRTVERWIAKGKFPAPVKYGKNKIGFPLADFVAWGEAKSVTLAAEIERLATTRATDLRPESIEKTLAKRLNRQYGEKFTPHQIMYGAVRDATSEETAAIRASQYAQLDHCGRQAFGELDLTHPARLISIIKRL